MAVETDVEEPFRQGHEAAVARLAEHRLAAPSPEAVDRTREHLRAVYRDFTAHPHPRAVVLLTENVLIGVACREQFGEKPLRVDQVSSFSRALMRILNSFGHY